MIWGECKTYGGGKRTREHALQKNFWSPPKELLDCLVLVTCKEGNETPGGGGGTLPYEGGSTIKTFCGRGVLCAAFLPPSVFPTNRCDLNIASGDGFFEIASNALGPAKAYILAGTQWICAIKTRGLRQLERPCNGN